MNWKRLPATLTKAFDPYSLYSHADITFGPVTTRNVSSATGDYVTGNEEPTIGRSTRAGSPDATSWRQWKGKSSPWEWTMRTPCRYEFVHSTYTAITWQVCIRHWVQINWLCTTESIESELPRRGGTMSTLDTDLRLVRLTYLWNNVTCRPC